MRPADFWTSTVREIISIIEVCHTKKEEENRTQWEIARWQSFINILPHVDKKKGGVKKPSDLALFPWESNLVSPAQHLPKEEVFTEEDNAWFEKMKQKPLSKSALRWQGQ